MSKLLVADATPPLEKILLKPDFKIVWQKGSYRFYRHDDGRYTTIPYHGSDDLGRPLIREILKQVDISDEEYL